MLVHSEHLGHYPLPRVVLGERHPSLDERRSHVLILEQLHKYVFEDSGVVGAHEHPGLASPQHRSVPRDIRGNDRNAAGQRLDQHEAEAFTSK